MAFVMDEQRLWYQIENYMPGVKEEFEAYVVMLKLINQNACLKINYGMTSRNEPLIRCHVFKDIGLKVFTCYYNVKSNNIFVRNEVDKHTGKLKTYSERIIISSLEDLKVLLKKII